MVDLPAFFEHHPIFNCVYLVFEDFFSLSVFGHCLLRIPVLHLGLRFSKIMVQTQCWPSKITQFFTIPYNLLKILSDGHLRQILLAILSREILSMLTLGALDVSLELCALNAGKLDKNRLKKERDS